MSLLILYPARMHPGSWYERQGARVLPLPDWLAAILISIGLHAAALPWLPAPESRILPVVEQVRQSLVVMLGAEPAQDASAAATEMPMVSLDALNEQIAGDPLALPMSDLEAQATPMEAISVPVDAAVRTPILALDASVSNQVRLAATDIAYSEVALSSLVIETGIEAHEVVVASDLLPPATKATSKPVQAAGSVGRYGAVPGIDAAFQRKLASHIQGFVAYVKKISEDKKIEGQAMIRYEIDRAGNLLQSEITRSTGHTELDAAILQMLEFASPMIPLPKEHPTGRQFFGQTISVWLKSAPAQ